MADQQSTGLLGLPVGVWVALLVGVAGAFALSQKPFQDTRPPNSVLPLDHRPLDDGQNIEARLWEDPLSAVALARKSDSPAEAYAPPQLRKTVQDDALNNKRTLVLSVMINGGAYTDDSEARRRARYAVLAGLYRSGFIPVNPDHIGFMFTDQSVQVVARGQPQPPAVHVNDIAAFEWFKRDSTVISQEATPSSPGSDPCGTDELSSSAVRATPEQMTRCDRVLLLWLDQEGFRESPIRRLSDFEQYMSGGTSPLVTYAVLGPANSDGLRAMYKEMQAADARKDPWPENLLPLTFYSSRATASDLVFHGGLSTDKSFADELHTSSDKLAFFRTVTDDQRVATKLLGELSDRGIKPGEIALVAERDTLYARGMGSYFGSCRNHPHLDPQPPDTDRSDHRRPEQVRCFTYLRGLDGLVATTSKSGDSTHHSQPANSSDSRQVNSTPADSSDEAIGPSQLDYLRRLAASIEGLRQRNFRIKAIGVISSDVYDKLLVLQALRSALPNVTYFTFDMDARMLEPGNLKWTRQLLVGSSLGLSLRGPLQGDIPPFRDSYQTSTFFATLLALHRFVSSSVTPVRSDQPSSRAAVSELGECPRTEDDKRDDQAQSTPPEATQPGLQWSHHPRIFEIGRSQAFDLIADSGGESCRFDKCCGHIAAARESWLWSSSGWPTNALVAGIITAALCLIAGAVAFGSRGLIGLSRTRKIPLLGARRWNNGIAWTVFVSALIIAVLGGWHWLTNWITHGGTRVPTPLFGGASQWTTGIVDAVAILTAIILVVRGQRKLYDNAESMRREFGFQNSPRELVQWHKRQLIPRRLRQRGLALFWFPIRPLPRQSGVALASGKVSPLEAVIAQYLHRGTTSARLVRVCCETVISGIVLAGVELILGITILRLSINALSLGSLFATQFLILWTADALFLSRSFLLALWRDKPPWPSEVLQGECRNIGVAETRAVLWLDLRLIARRTTTVSHLVWYPSLVIAALAIGSLMNEFKDFQFANNPIALLVGALFVIASAIALRRAAEFWRAQVRHRLEDERLRECKGTDDRSARQLDSLLERVHGLNEGAFAPYSEQPIVRAVLVPALTYGATLGLQRTHLGF